MRLSSENRLALAALGLALAVAAGCGGGSSRGGSGPDADGDSDSDSDSDADAGSDAGTDAGADTDTGSDSETGTEYDCSSVPAGPFEFIFLGAVVSGEDIAFDDDGFLVGMSSSSLFKSAKSGTSALWVADAGCASGLRALSTGDVVCNGGGSLILIEKDTGIVTTVASDFSYPNGIEVDLEGYAYVSDQGTGQVRKLDPYTGDSWVIASGLSAPNGLSFSPDYARLYVGSFGGGTITAIPFDDEGNPGAPAPFFSHTDPPAAALGMGGAFDGMGVDICGNVYVCVYVEARVFRISPDASTVEVVANLSSVTSWIPNLQWGPGLGGWGSDMLYVSNMGGGVFEVPVGVPGKHRAYP